MKYILLLLLVSLAHAQPYEPTFLLDVTGEIDQQLGFTNLQALGDQNGDGFDDFLTSVMYPNDVAALRLCWGNNSGISDYIEFGRFYSLGREFFWRDAAFDAGFTVPAGDMNGDGYPDILRDLNVSYDNQPHYYTYLFLGGPSVFDTIADWTGNLTDMRFTTNVGDYNGDGKDDFTKRPLSAQYFGLFLGSEPPLSQTYEWDHQPNRNHMGFGDVNGDGFSDFGMSYHLNTPDYSEMDIFLGSPDADSIPGLVYQREPGEIESNGRIVGDINGDGYDDVMTRLISLWIGRRWYVYYGGENMDFEIDEELVWGNGNDSPEYATPLGDINADGFDDFALYRDNQQPPIDDIEVWLGGNPLPTTPAWVLEGELDGMNYPYRIGQAGDFNGDGIDDWFFSAYHGLEARGRIIVIAGDRDFGLPVNEHPVVTPASFILHPCFPNPFNSSVTIPLEIAGGGTQQVTLSVLNPLGQVVYRFDQKSFTPGTHMLRWNGVSNSATQVATGTYFLRAHSQYQNSVQPLHLIK